MKQKPGCRGGDSNAMSSRGSSAGVRTTIVRAAPQVEMNDDTDTLLEEMNDFHRMTGCDPYLKETGFAMKRTVTAWRDLSAGFRRQRPLRGEPPTVRPDVPVRQAVKKRIPPGR